ncbi:MAG: hypothetical protein WB615_16685 [Candidatus Tumulicola sp.]
MVRFGLSLVAASLIVFSGYSALGAATGSTGGPSLKVIAVVVAHARHRSSVSTLRSQPEVPVVVQ